MTQVSVIVPVYNVEKYLNECLDSIMNQTYQNFELILIDDGSTDKSGDICDRYASEYANIIVIHQKNLGQAAARNNGIVISMAHWIMFVDSDDVIHSHLLEYLIRSIIESGANCSAALIERNSALINGFIENRQYNYHIFEINDSFLSRLYTNSEEKNNDIYWLILPKIFKSSVIKSTLFKPGRIFEDNEVTVKWLVESKSIAIIPEEMYFYRNNPAGTMNRKFSIKTLDYLWALEQQIEYYHNIGYKKILKLVIEDYFYNSVHFGKQFINELNDEVNCRRLMVDTNRKLNKYSNYCNFDLDIHTKNFIMKYSHPLEFKVKKKIRNIKLHIQCLG